jgi:hypothetical protein
MRTLVVLAVALAMSGCVTPQEREAMQTRADDASCQSYGAKPGSPEYVQCRTAKSQQHEMANATMAAAVISSPTCTSFGYGVVTCN